MKILDRYVVKSIVAIFLTTILVFSLLYVLIDSASNLDEFIDRKIPLDILIQYYLTYLPVVLSQTAPIACLISVLFAYSNLSSHNEVIALRSSGLNFWQITKPALWLALVVSALIFLMNEKLIPHAEDTARQLRNEHMILEVDRKKHKKAKIKNLTFYGLRNRLYFIDTFDPNTYELEGITIIEYDNEQNIKGKTVALNGVWTGIAWKFYQCHITTFPQDINEPTKIRVYQEKLADIKETPEDFLKQRLQVSSMNIRQLSEYISRFSNSGAKTALNNLRVDLHQKIAYPFSNIIIVLVGLPFAVMTGRRKAQTFTSLGLAIAIGFLYYVTNSVGLALGKGGFFPPVISAWLAPMIFLGLASYVIKTKI